MFVLFVCLFCLFFLVCCIFLMFLFCFCFCFVFFVLFCFVFVLFCFVFEISKDNLCLQRTRVQHPWAFFSLTNLCIFLKNKATLDKVSHESGQKC